MYRHALSFNDTLAMLALTPIGIGAWWYSTFDSPDHTG